MWTKLPLLELHKSVERYSIPGKHEAKKTCIGPGILTYQSPSSSQHSIAQYDSEKSPSRSSASSKETEVWNMSPVLWPIELPTDHFLSYLTGSICKKCRTPGSLPHKTDFSTLDRYQGKGRLTTAPERLQYARRPQGSSQVEIGKLLHLGDHIHKPTYDICPEKS